MKKKKDEDEDVWEGEVGLTRKRGVAMSQGSLDHLLVDVAVVVNLLLINNTSQELPVSIAPPNAAGKQLEDYRYTLL